MREPKRKPGKYTHLKPDPSITREKYEELEKELNRIHKARPNLIAEVQRLAEMGDFSENAAYQMAKGRLRRFNWRILEIETQLKNAQIIKTPTNNKTVQLGCTVTFTFNGIEKTFTILGSTETNPDKNIISHHSPLGSQLLGMKLKETKQISIADKEVECKILKIT